MSDSSSSSAQSMPRFRSLEQVNRWIESAHRKGTRVRIPVVVRPGGPLMPTPVHLDVPLSDSLPLKIDDGGLGIAFADRVRQNCSGKTNCSLWLEGVWGELIGSELWTLEKRPIFAVLLVEQSS